ncbi:MAG: hypothetical protein HUK22_00530 [Thermoguttaceae bacterium]|nr:hypothetical protein [Thermoguttaceae bacterium]
MTSIYNALAEAFASPAFWNICAAFGACAVAACKCGKHGCEDDDRDGDCHCGDDCDCGGHCHCGCGEDDPDFAYNMREYEDFVAQLAARVEELRRDVAGFKGDPAVKSELVEELAGAILSQAEISCEGGDWDDAEAKFLDAFQVLESAIAEGASSVSARRLYGDSRLRYGVVLEDAGEIEKAEAQFADAREIYESLCESGDSGARLDLAGLRLNVAGIKYERGETAFAMDELDAVAKDFRQIAADLAESDPERAADARHYAAKTLATKADFMRSLGEDSEEANALTRQAIAQFRECVAAGDERHVRDLADSLVAAVSSTEVSEPEQIDALLADLDEARGFYEKAMASGESDAVVDLFDAETLRGDILTCADRTTDAYRFYKDFVEEFAEFESSDQFAIIMGFAVANNRLGRLEMELGRGNSSIPRFEKALELAQKLAEFIRTMFGDGENCDGECDDCGGRHDEGCGCGCGCGRVDEESRAEILETTAQEVYDLTLKCYFDLAFAHSTQGKGAEARALCVEAEKFDKEFRAILRPGETLTSEFRAKIRDLKAVVR